MISVDARARGKKTESENFDSEKGRAFKHAFSLNSLLQCKSKRAFNKLVKYKQFHYEIKREREREIVH